MFDASSQRGDSIRPRAQAMPAKNGRAAAKASAQAKGGKKKKASFTMAHADAFGLPPLMKRSIAARDCKAANGLIVA